MSLTTEQKQDAVTMAEHVLSLLGLEASAEVVPGDEDVALHLDTEEPGRLIGRKGHGLRSLELLLNRMLRKKYKRCDWVIIDVDGYQRKRRPRRRGGRKSAVSDEDTSRIEKMAGDAVKEVRRWGEPQRLGLMTAAERRVVHTALREETGITTESEETGVNGKKRVVVRLANSSDAPADE